MAGSFQTGSAEMMQAVQSMDQTNQSLQQAGKALENEVEQAMGGWGGTAAKAFQSLMTKFSEDLNNLNQDLQQIGEAVTGNNTRYQQQEQEAQSSMSSIMNALG